MFASRRVFVCLKVVWLCICESWMFTSFFVCMRVCDLYLCVLTRVLFFVLVVSCVCVLRVSLLVCLGSWALCVCISESARLRAFLC